MRNIEPKENGQAFEALIRSEEDAALARFRSEDFESKVRRRIAAASPGENDRPIGRIFTRPVWIAAAAGILLIAVGIAVLHRPAPRPDLARSIEGILRLAPGIEALEAGLWAGGGETETVSAAPDARNLAALLIGGMSSAAARSAAAGADVPRKSREARPLSLEEMYRIVSVDKSIERVLMLVS